jgi:hypothetical protein
MYQLICFSIGSVPSHATAMINYTTKWPSIAVGTICLLESKHIIATSFQLLEEISVINKYLIQNAQT